MSKKRRSGSTLSARPCDVTHRVTCTPNAPSLRSSTQMPSSPAAPRRAVTPKAAAVAIMASSSECTNQRMSLRWPFRSRIGYATSCPGPWNVTLPPRSDCTTLAPAASISSRVTSTLASQDCSRPSVKTGGCSTSSSVSRTSPRLLSWTSSR
eukprot:scaffold3688_cov71-Phaeocystis_antarctica.AAC.2